MIADPLPLPTEATDLPPAAASAPAPAACAPLAPAGAGALLDAAPAALLHAGSDGRVSWSNAAAMALLGAAAQPGRSLFELWSPAADTATLDTVLRGPDAVALDLPLREPTAAAHWVHVAGQPLPGGGAVLALHAIDDRRGAQAEVQHLSELLDLAREFGRLGVWERNVRTLEGQWDRQVYRYWGLDPDAPTPNFAEAAQRVAAPDREDFLRFFRDSLQQPGRYATRYRVRGDDGTLRRIHSQWVVKPGTDGRPERVLGLMMDDSEPFRLAASTSELESQLALAVDLGDIAVWRHDLASGRMHFNAEAFRIVGLPSRSEGATVDELTALVHPDDRERAAAAAREARNCEHPVDLEVRFRRSDGAWRTVMTRRVAQRDAGGRVVAFVGVGLDVTGRHIAELALRSAVERVALAARGAGLGTWEQDLVSGEVYWDPQMWVLRGHVPQARPMTAAERMACVHPDDRAAIQNHFHPALAAGRPHEHQFRVVWPDGQVRWLASRSVELRDELTGTRRRIGVNWDVTDNRTAEAVRQEREIALRESQAKSKFLARMSHELRTPLNAVLGFSQLLLDEETAADDGTATRRRRLEHILSAGQHLLHLINDVLDLASLEGGEVRIELQPLALAPLVAETLPLLGPLRNARPVTLRTDGLELLVLADATRLRQVLLNLLSNAIKYNREGGEVAIEARQRGDTAIVRVADTGLGMSDQQLRHLFEPFNRLGIDGGAIEGTGIGLAIVKSLVERMGGSVHVDSTLGKGSVFELRLQAGGAAGGNSGAAAGRAPPLPAAASAAPATAAPTAVPGTGRRCTLLYIEDNPVNAIIVSELLARRSDLVLHVAVDGADGVAQAAALQPDLILLDMQLPDCDGFEVLRRLRATPATEATPCIALSANAMPEDIERALRAGMADYWTKPLDFSVFIAALDGMFAKAN
jgi:hypothetical protein